MSDYNSMKVPELKKLLQTRSLGVTGNKADLVARLVEDDKSKTPGSSPLPRRPPTAYVLTLLRF